MTTHENRLMAWMLEEGFYPPAPKTWHVVTYEQGRDSWIRPRSVAHTRSDCRNLDGRQSTAATLTAEEALGHDLCRECWIASLHPNKDHEEEKALTLAAHHLHRQAGWLEAAESTDHVLVGRNSRALHGAIVHDVTAEVSNQLAKDTPEELAALRDHLSAICSALKQRYPYSPENVLRDATVIAVKHNVRQGLSNQLYAYALKGHYNAVQELFSTWLDLVVNLEDGVAQLAEILDGEKAQGLVVAGVPLEEIVGTWKEKYLAASALMQPAYYFASGLPSAMHSVPRGCRDHLVGYGLRGRDVVWGVGILPAVVVDWLAANQGDRDTKVRRMGIAYQGELDRETVETAIFLMREAQTGKADTYRNADDALQAAILL